MKPVISIILFLMLLCFGVFLGEGIKGFVPFINLVTFFIVICGLVILCLGSFSLKDIFMSLRISILKKTDNDLLNMQIAINFYTFAQNIVIGIGCISSIIGFIMMLFTITDVSNVPYRLAFTLTGILYAVVISEIIIPPLKNSVISKIENENKSKGEIVNKRIILTGLIIFFIISNFLIVLFALTKPISALIQNMPYESWGTMLGEDKLKSSNDIRIPLGDYFENNSQEISNRMKIKLKTIMPLLEDLSKSKLAKIMIEVYGDSLFKEASKELTKIRAQNIENYIKINYPKISSKIINVSCYIDSSTYNKEDAYIINNQLIFRICFLKYNHICYKNDF